MVMIIGAIVVSLGFLGLFYYAGNFIGNLFGGDETCGKVLGTIFVILILIYAFTVN